MPNKNWFDRLFNPYDFAYAYAEVDPVIEDKKEEEELFKQFFEWRIGRFIRRVGRGVSRGINKVTKTASKAVGKTLKKAEKVVDKTVNVVKQPAQYVVNKAIAGVKDVTGVTAAQNEARKAYKEAAEEQKKQEAAYKRISAETSATIEKNKAAYAKQKAEGESQVKTAQEGSRSARLALDEAIATGKRNVAYATKQTAATKSRLQSEKVQKDAAAALKAKQAASKVTTAKAPGVSGTTVKAIGGLGGTGKTGSARSKTKGPKDKAGKLLIG